MVERIVSKLEFARSISIENAVDLVCEKSFSQFVGKNAFQLLFQMYKIENENNLTDFFRIISRFHYIVESKTGKIHEAGDVISDCWWIKLCLRLIEIKEEN